MSDDIHASGFGLSDDPFAMQKIELVGGPRDGEVFLMRPGQQQLRCHYVVNRPYETPVADEPILPTMKVGFYTWRTEADMMLGRWSWSENE